MRLNDTTALAPDVVAGAALYSKAFLAVYDLILHNMTTYLAWQCPTPGVLAFFRDNVSHNHLDIGVGTGFFLRRCLHAPATQRIGLMDLNPNCLNKAAAAIPGYAVERYQANILAPLDFHGGRFDSCSLMHLLHCLPGSISEKSALFDHLGIMLNPGAAIYGITILQPDASTNGFGQLIIANSNRRGHFCNLRDSLEGLKAALEQRFSACEVQRIGQLALFKARMP